MGRSFTSGEARERFASTVTCATVLAAAASKPAANPLRLASAPLPP